MLRALLRVSLAPKFPHRWWGNICRDECYGWERCCLLVCTSRTPQLRDAPALPLPVLVAAMLRVFPMQLSVCSHRVDTAWICRVKFVH